MKVIVSYSGGKDSQACLIWAANKYGADGIEAVFCDTGWEHPDTYAHIISTTAQMGVKLTTLKSEYDFISLAKKKKRFPSTKARFCTEELKTRPMIDYVLSHKEHLLIIQGIRSGESMARKNMEAECMYFRGYLEPYGYDKRGKARYYTYRKSDVKEWLKHYDASILRPIKEWSAQDVIDYILNNRQQPNPLYSRGFSRVGCFPCIMCRKQEAKLISQDEFGRDRLLRAETEVGTNFFPPTYIPSRFCKNKQFPMAQEVFDYVNRNDVGMDDMFEPEGGYSCMSIFHGLCE